MKKRISAILAFIMVLGMSSMLTGCGTSLDRDVAVQGMNIKVPSEWAETAPDTNNEAEGVYYYEEKDDEQSEEETPNRIVIQYEMLSQAPYKTAAEAMEANRIRFEEEYGVTYWSIDEEDHKIIDGAQVNLYKYSFIKEIDSIRQKYEGQIIYVYSADMCYTIAVYGDGADAAKLIDAIEF